MRYPNKHKSTPLFTGIILLAGVLGMSGASPAPLPKSTPWDLEKLFHAPAFEWKETNSKVRALQYKAEPWKGKPTHTFAYYASPRDFGAKGRKFPGIVLVHGGGGAAFDKWVKIWAERGYAAIAMDLAGCGAGRRRLPDGGPGQDHGQKFHTIDGPIGDQWPYHAVANVILAHSLLRSLDEVDENRTALTGISWGGYLTCIVAGLDHRFQVAMPVYGCGFLRENSCWVPSEFGRMSREQSDKWHKLWDPSRYMGSARMPVMFLNGTNDFAYPMDSHARTCALVQTPKNYSIQLRMKHGHIFDFPEFFLFVDQYLKEGTPMPVVSRPELRDGRVSAGVKAATRLISARLHYTTGPHVKNKTRPWVTMDLELKGNRVSGQGPPPEATVWYVDVRDERKALVSSEVIVP